MEWDDFAVQIEDPQPRLFQLGFVNLPSGRDPGRRGRIRRDSERVLAARRRVRPGTTRRPSEATTLSFGEDDDGNPLEFTVPDGARLPLTPDWTATLGIEFRSSGQLFDAQPFARFDYCLRRRVGQFARGYRIGRLGHRPSSRTPTRRATCASGWRATPGARRSSSTTSGTSARSCSSATAGPCSALSVNPPRTYGLQLRFNF